MLQFGDAKRKQIRIRAAPISSDKIGTGSELRTHSRLQVGDTAEWNSALLFRSGELWTEKLRQAATRYRVGTGRTRYVCPWTRESRSTLQRHPASPRYHHAAALDTGFDCARDFAGGGSTEGGDEFVRTASITELDATDISVVVVAVIFSEQQGEAGEQREPIVGETQAAGLLADLDSINEFFKDWMNARAGKVHGQRNSVPHAGRDIA